VHFEPKLSQASGSISNVPLVNAPASASVEDKTTQVHKRANAAPDAEHEGCTKHSIAAAFSCRGQFTSFWLGSASFRRG